MSFEKIYRQYYPELFRFALQLKVRETDCDDLVQEVFTRYLSERHKGRKTPEKLRAWLYKVLLNRVRDNHKRLQYSKKAAAEFKHTGLKHVDEQALFMQKEKRELMFEILEGFPEKEKNLLLFYHNGLSYAEIAEILEINPNTVGTLIARNLRKLKEQLKKQYHELFE